MSKRRANGEGSVWRATDGRGWLGAIHLNGKRRYVRAATKTLARARLARLVADAQAGQLSSTRTTVAELLARRLDDLSAEGRRPRTLQTCETIARLHLVPLVGARRVRDLRPTDIRQLLRDLASGGLSAATIVKARSVLYGALRLAVVEELIPANPAAAVPAPTVPHYQARALSLEEVASLIEAATGHRLEHLWRFIIKTGCRWGEAAGLQWHSVDLRRGVVRIEQAAAKVPRAARAGGPTWELAQLKTDRSRRSLPLEPSDLASLRQQRDQVEQLRAEAGDRWQEHDLVFPRPSGAPLGNAKVGLEWRAVVAAAGIPGRVRMHDLRHSHATLLRSLGADITTIRDQLGHATIRQTAEIYVHFVAGPQRDASGALERAISGATAVPVADQTAETA